MFTYKKSHKPTNVYDLITKKGRIKFFYGMRILLTKNKKNLHFTLILQSFRRLTFFEAILVTNECRI